jgi:hypothetical protein
MQKKSAGAAMIGIALVAGLGSTPPGLAAEASKAEKQAAIRKEAQTTLTRLYAIHPGAKSAIQKAAGYAAFDNFGLNLLLLSTARGKGIAVAQATLQGTKYYKDDDLN